MSTVYLIHPENWFNPKSDPRISCILVSSEKFARQILNEMIPGFKITKIQTELLVVPEYGFISDEVFGNNPSHLVRKGDTKSMYSFKENEEHFYYSMTFSRDEFCEKMYPKAMEIAKEKEIQKILKDLYYKSSKQKV